MLKHAFLFFCVSVLTPSAVLAQSSAPLEVLDVREQVIPDLDRRVERWSQENVVIIARGYDHEFLQQVYNGLRDVTDQGTPITYVVTQNAPSRPNKVVLEVWVAGSRMGAPSLHQIGDSPPQNTRIDWRDLAISASSRLQLIREERAGAEADRRRREETLLNTYLESRFGNRETIRYWESSCIPMENPEFHDRLRDALIEQGETREDADYTVALTRMGCVPLMIEIRRRRRALGLLP